MSGERPEFIGIVAMTNRRVIGKAGQLPWHYPEDLRFFRQTTTGHALLMGRKTYESIGKPLPNRRNIVLSRNMAAMPGVEVIRDFSELWDLPGLRESGQKVFLIGGAELFAQLLGECDGLYLTHVLKDYEGDTVLEPFEHQFDAGRLLSNAPGLEFRYHLRKR
jgi:dihydrofolate reductase